MISKFLIIIILTIITLKSKIRGKTNFFILSFYIISKFPVVIILSTIKVEIMKFIK